MIMNHFVVSERKSKMLIFKEIKFGVKSSIFVRDKNEPDEVRLVKDGAHIDIRITPVVTDKLIDIDSTRFPCQCEMNIYRKDLSRKDDILSALFDAVDTSSTKPEKSRTNNILIYMTADEYNDVLNDPLKFYKEHLLSKDDITFEDSSVSNTNTTIAQSLRNAFYSVTGRGTYTISGDYAGMVQNNGTSVK